MLGWAAAFASLMALGAANDPDLERARQALEKYDDDGAEAALAVVRQRLDTLDPQLAKETLRLSAEVALRLDRFDEAEEHLLSLLIRDPEYAPAEGAWPPQWLYVYERAKKRVPDRQPPDVAVEAPPQGAPGEGLVVYATATDDSGVNRVVLVVEKPQLEIEMTKQPDGRWAATIPGANVKSPDVRFWVEAFDKYGNGPGYHGRPRRPTRVPITGLVVAPPPPPSASGPITGEWWFWAIAGVVVVGAGVGVAVVATSSDDSGRVRANVRFP